MDSGRKRGPSTFLDGEPIAKRAKTSDNISVIKEYMDARQYMEASILCAESILSDPDNLEYYLLQGQALYFLYEDKKDSWQEDVKNETLEAALSAFNKIINNHADHSLLSTMTEDAYYFRSFIYFLTNQLALGIEDMKVVTRSGKEFDEYHGSLMCHKAMEFFKQDNWDLAILFFKIAEDYYQLTRDEASVYVKCIVTRAMAWRKEYESNTNTAQIFEIEKMINDLQHAKGIINDLELEENIAVVDGEINEFYIQVAFACQAHGLFAKAVNYFCKLRTFYIAEAAKLAVTREIYSAMTKAVQKNDSVELNFNGTATNEDLCFFTELLCLNNALQSKKLKKKKIYADFSGSKINDDGVINFADKLPFLADQDNLTIYLENNPITVLGVTALAKAYESQRCPAGLKIVQNYLSKEEILPVIAALPNKGCPELTMVFPADLITCFADVLAEGKFPALQLLLESPLEKNIDECVDDLCTVLKSIPQSCLQPIKLGIHFWKKGDFLKKLENVLLRSILCVVEVTIPQRYEGELICLPYCEDRNQLLQDNIKHPDIIHYIKKCSKEAGLLDLENKSLLKATENQKTEAEHSEDATFIPSLQLLAGSIFAMPSSIQINEITGMPEAVIDYVQKLKELNEKLNPVLFADPKLRM